MSKKLKVMPEYPKKMFKLNQCTELLPGNDKIRGTLSTDENFVPQKRKKKIF